MLFEAKPWQSSFAYANENNKLKCLFMTRKIPKYEVSGGVGDVINSFCFLKPGVMAKIFVSGLVLYFPIHLHEQRGNNGEF